MSLIYKDIFKEICGRCPQNRQRRALWVKSLMVSNPQDASRDSWGLLGTQGTSWKERTAAAARQIGQCSGNSWRWKLLAEGPREHWPPGWPESLTGRHFCPYISRLLLFLGRGGRVSTLSASEASHAFLSGSVTARGATRNCDIYTAKRGPHRERGIPLRLGNPFLERPAQICCLLAVLWGQMLSGPKWSWLMAAHPESSTHPSGLCRCSAFAEVSQ